MVKPISLNNTWLKWLNTVTCICIHFKMLGRTSKKAFKFRILIVNNQTEYMINGISMKT